MRLLFAAAGLFLAVAPVMPWHPAGDTLDEHLGQTATLLHDGRVLVVGGSGNLSGVELYDPVRRSWSGGPPASVPRADHGAVRLDDGRVLVAGGEQDHVGYLASAELFDPKDNRWSTAAPMSTPRSRFTLTLLPDGRVLAAGGAPITASAETYDPKSNSWSPVPPMSSARFDAGAILLRTGQVLVAGGMDALEVAGTAGLTSAELFDYRTNAWTPIPPMHSGRAAAAVALLPDGSALFAGGNDFSLTTGLSTNTAEYYRPASNRWFDAPSLNLARGNAGFAQLSDGSVLVVGGFSRNANVRTESSAELLDPQTRRWTLLPSTGVTRQRATVTALPTGEALIVGGTRSQTAQIYQPAVTAPVRPATLGNAVADNRLLLLLTAGLLLLVLGQLAWRSQTVGAR